MRSVVIGAGMAGVLSHQAARGWFRRVTVHEKADRLGGTLRENTHRGIACEVPAHPYAYTFAPHPEWSHVFAPAPEILAYFESVATFDRVDALIRYSNEVRRREYDGNRWRI